VQSLTPPVNDHLMELLMMIDVPRDRVEEIEEIVKRHHPEAGLEGVEPNIPEFP